MDADVSAAVAWIQAVRLGAQRNFDALFVDLASQNARLRAELEAARSSSLELQQRLAVSEALLHTTQAQNSAYAADLAKLAATAVALRKRLVWAWSEQPAAAPSSAKGPTAPIPADPLSLTPTRPTRSSRTGGGAVAAVVMGAVGAGMAMLTGGARSLVGGGANQQQQQAQVHPTDGTGRGLESAPLGAFDTGPSGPRRHCKYLPVPVASDASSVGNAASCGDDAGPSMSAAELSAPPPTIPAAHSTAASSKRRRVVGLRPHRGPLALAAVACFLRPVTCCLRHCAAAFRRPGVLPRFSLLPCQPLPQR